MEQLIAELKAKSIYLESIDRFLFFSWDLFATSKNYDITIDAHALIDPSRNLGEVVKLVYLCMVKYSETAKALGMESLPPLGLKEVEAWMSIKPHEATEAMKYITRILEDNDKKKAGIMPEKSPSANSENPLSSNKIRGKWKFFSFGVKRGFSKES